MWTKSFPRSPRNGFNFQSHRIMWPLCRFTLDLWAFYPNCTSSCTYIERSNSYPTPTVQLKQHVYGCSCVIVMQASISTSVCLYRLGMMQSMFQRILGLQWGWQSALLVCDGQRWSSQGGLGSCCLTHTPAELCCPLQVVWFTATLGLVFQAILWRGNYLQQARQQQIKWVRPWWCRQMTGRCWYPGRQPACRERSGSQTLWFWTQEEKKHN